MQEQATSSLAASSLPSSSERSSSSAFHLEVKEGMESDEEIRRVPEIGGESAGASASGLENGSLAGPDRVQAAGESQRKRARNPADKESKRLKRLLRNRVSAQQARERKKAYLNDLEVRVKELEQKNSELDERLSTLQNENQMLRQALLLTAATATECRYDSKMKTLVELCAKNASPGGKLIHESDNSTETEQMEIVVVAIRGYGALCGLVKNLVGALNLWLKKS